MGFVSIMLLNRNEKHPLEALQSWNLYQQRQGGERPVWQDDEPRSMTGSRRVLKASKADDTTLLEVKESKEENQETDNEQQGQQPPELEFHHETPYKKIHKASGNTMHGMMIDAGSQGTRIHVYEFEDRMLHNQDEIFAAANGEMLTIPTTNTRWTDKYKPGLDVLAQYRNGDLEGHVASYLGPLLDFAKQVLKDKESQWHQFPIYLKATGGLRTLPTPDRVQLINTIRRLFRNTTFNPFNFVDERARVISGEEEGAYGWVAVNYIKGKLVEQTLGAGTVLNPQMTFGMVEMGGASTQIGFFENNGDVMANLFKLQLGGARHWNIYTHSFLYFGVNGAWSRLNAALLWKEDTHVNPCLPAHSQVVFSSWIHMNQANHWLPRSSPDSIPYSTTMSNNKSDFELCSNLTFQLLRTSANEEWVDFSHDGDCSFAGVYQPPLPYNQSDVDEFIATSNYADIFAFLRLGTRSSIAEIGAAAKKVCELDWETFKKYNQVLPFPIDDGAELAQYCFRSVFVYQILRNGYGFADDFEITAVDVLNGQKLGWALGSILYEINILPWKFHPKLKVKGPTVGAPWTSWGSPAAILLDFESDRFDFALQSIGPLAAIVTVLVATALSLLNVHRQKRQHHYSFLGDVSVESCNSDNG